MKINYYVFFISLVFSLKFSYTSSAAIDYFYNFGITLGKHALSISLDYVPFVGNVKCISEAFSGKDKITGKELSRLDRTFSFIGGIPVASYIKKGKDLLEGLKAIKGAGKLLYSFKKSLYLKKESEDALRQYKDYR